jgi:ABC-type multidrug transport system ATPase subunit
MQIILDQVGKRYRQEWIFRDLSQRFEPARSYAVTGPNGSGKSTLLKLLCGQLSPSTGTLQFLKQGRPLPTDEVFSACSFAAPYIELIEEFTLREMIAFHGQFKPLLPGLDEAAVLELLAFPRATRKEVRHFSSGMKQRLKLALALCANTPVLLLDEPTTNLDRQGMDWYRQMVERFLPGRLTVIASNLDLDFDFCQEKIDITGYKVPAVEKNMAISSKQ